MRRRDGHKAVDPATQTGIEQALRRSFDDLEQRDDAELERLINQMKDFEGSNEGERG